MVEVGFPGDGPLTFDVLCRTQRGGPGTRHPVTVHPDGTVETPHDLALERVAAAMGGYLSCLELVDRFVPAVRDLWGQWSRLAPPAVTRREGRWVVRDAAPGCGCAHTGWPRPEPAVEHVQDPKHWARRHGGDARELVRWVAELGEDVLVRPSRPAWTGDLSDAVAAEDDLEWLWRVGVGPDVVRRIHAALGLDQPLRAATYLDVASGAVDLTWLARFAPHGAEAVAWASATHDERDDAEPGERLAWLAAGVGRRLVLPLLAGPYSPDDVRRLAAAAGWTVGEAGHVLVDWLAARCAPAVDDLAAVCRTDLSRYAPSGNAIGALRERAGDLAAGMTTTELGFLLVTAGSVTAAMSVLTRRMGAAGDEDAEGAA